MAILNSDVRGAVNIGSQQPIKFRDLAGRRQSVLDGPICCASARCATRPGDAPLVLADTTRFRTDVGSTPRFSHAEGLDRTIGRWRGQMADESKQIFEPALMRV